TPAARSAACTRRRGCPAPCAGSRASARVFSSFGLDPRALDDRAPLLALRAHEAGELLGAHRRRLHLRLENTLAHVAITKDSTYFSVESCDNRGRGACRREEPHPGAHPIAGHAGFGAGRTGRPDR